MIQKNLGIILKRYKSKYIIDDRFMFQSGGVYETNDAGKTWTNIFDQTSHVYSVAMDPNTSSTLYIVTRQACAQYV